MKKKLFSIASVFALAVAANAQTSLDVVIDSDMTLPSGSEWKLNGVTYVAPGVTLTIEPGVTVYAETEDNATEAPALIVTAGATINAVGTAEAPIVFTSILAKTEELDHNDVGLWSGVILLGDAVINADENDFASGEGVILKKSIEGLSAIGRGGLDTATEEEYLTYGGTDDGDSSGDLEYVSIRHTGFSISGIAGDEIQGLTLGGVGSATVLENIEIFVSDDDGIEIFGGMPQLKNILLAYAEDDSLDLDQGFRGTVENLFILQVAFTDKFGNERNGDHGGEWDGADSPEDNEPYALGHINHVTLVQAGVDGAKNDDAIRIRNGGRHQLTNFVCVTNDDQFIRLDNNDEGENTTLVEDGVADGDTFFKGCIFWNGGVNTVFDLYVKDVHETGTVDITDFIDPEAALATISDEANNNNFVDPGILVSVDEAGKAVVTIPTTGNLYNGDNGYDSDYVGAFNKTNWADWTLLSKEGYIVFETSDIEPGWVKDPVLGWVYSYSGNIGAGEFVAIQYYDNSQKNVYIATEDEAGAWVYFFK